MKYVCTSEILLPACWKFVDTVLQLTTYTSVVGKIPEGRTANKRCYTRGKKTHASKTLSLVQINSEGLSHSPEKCLQRLCMGTANEFLTLELHTLILSKQPAGGCTVVLSLCSIVTTSVLIGRGRKEAFMEPTVEGVGVWKKINPD